MGKHINSKIKYHYVMRYLNGESATKLGLEVINKGLSNHKSANTKPGHIILRWKYQYYGFGLENKSGLKSTGRNKKEKNIEDMTREELIEQIKIWKDIHKAMEEVEEEYNEDKKKRYKVISKLNNKYSMRKLCKELLVSKSGYYNWIKNNKPMYGKYDPKLIDAIQKIYKKYNGNYGYKRIHIALNYDLDIKVNISTIIRYMKHLKLKAKIRQKKRNREIKNVNTKIPNLIIRNFNANNINQKWYTDITYIQLKDRWSYCSAIIDGNNNKLIDIKLSIHNDNQLVLSNIKDAIKNKDTSDLIIHSDHGYQYSSIAFQKLLKNNNIKQSMSRIGNSLDNRPIEYFFSILKQEYLRLIIIRDRIFDEVYNKLEYIKWHYNNVRFQSNLQNKTPCEYTVS